MTRVSKNIGLLDHLGGGNLGDDATLDAVMQNIEMRWPGAEISAFSMNPTDTRRRHGIPSYAIRKEIWTPGSGAQNSKGTQEKRVRTAAGKYGILFKLLKAIYRKPINLLRELVFLAKSFRIIRSFDLLIIAGGGQLLDSWGGPWKFPYTIFKWTIMARLSCTRCYFINVGAGPLSHPLSKWLIKSSLSLSDYVSFRDDKSRALIQEIGIRRRYLVRPDNVYSLDISALDRTDSTALGEKRVGISPMAYCDPRLYYHKDQNVYDSFINTLGSFGAWLIRNDYRLSLFSTDIWFDSQAIEDFKRNLRNKTQTAASSCIKHDPILGIDGLLSEISSMDYVVTCRFHGVIFAHLMNKPVLALSHHPKVTTLMADLGLSEYCVNIHACDEALLKDSFNRLVECRHGIKAQMASKAGSYKDELRKQFDELFRREPEWARGEVEDMANRKVASSERSPWRV
jgi:polysaccharide pyruvyl transferase WcaK-like protein